MNFQYFDVHNVWECDLKRLSGGFITPSNSVALHSFRSEKKMRVSLAVAISALVLLCCTRETYCQLTSIIFPEGIDGANPIISAMENTENVTFFCEVFRDGNQRETQWTLIKDGVETTILFTPEGLGQAGFENYEVSPEAVRTNITILVFDETFDNNQIGCGSGGEIVSIFDLRIISE